MREKGHIFRVFVQCSFSCGSLDQINYIGLLMFLKTGCLHDMYVHPVWQLAKFKDHRILEIIVARNILPLTALDPKIIQIFKNLQRERGDIGLFF